MWQLCSDNGWWSRFGKKQRRAKRAKAAQTSARPDRVSREFTAAAPNRLWLADLTEHRTAEGKPCLCAIKDCFSNRIVG